VYRSKMIKFCFGAAFVSAVTTTLLVACSSTTSPTGTTADSGTEPKSDASLVSDAGGSSGDLCAVEAAYEARCNPDAGDTPACTQALKAQCPGALLTKSKLYQDILLRCESATSSCDSKAESACEEGQFEQAMTMATAAQKGVRDRLCANCGGSDATSVEACKKDFFYNPAAGGIGAGLSVLLGSDAVAMQIDTKCILPKPDGGTSDECQTDFFQCAGEAYNAAQPAYPMECN
jgi:hypothetical protein